MENKEEGVAVHTRLGVVFRYALETCTHSAYSNTVHARYTWQKGCFCERDIALLQEDMIFTERGRASASARRPTTSTHATDVYTLERLRQTGVDGRWRPCSGRSGAGKGHNFLTSSMNMSVYVTITHPRHILENKTLEHRTALPTVKGSAK